MIPAALAERITRARHICVLTGAGISAESGVPTFREAQSGLWAKFSPEDLATPEAFLRDPELVWRWYHWRRELVARATPNAGHRALAELDKGAAKLTLVTQNVDGLHQRAGSRDVIEFHGNLFSNRCFVEGCLVEAPADGVVPVCPGCGAQVRPGVVWFGEAIPDAALRNSFAAAEDCDVFLSVGTSSLVYPAAGLADAALAAGAVVVEVNPQPTGLAERCDFVIAEKAGVALPKLLNCGLV
jgi:NAD-dependent deacetylase